MTSKLSGVNPPYIMSMDSAGQEYGQGTVGDLYLCSALSRSVVLTGWGVELSEGLLTHMADG